MTKHILPLSLALLFSASAAQAQVHVGIQLGLPALPQLELVAPGVQVVAGFQEEVFLQGGWYWCRRPDGWFRARNPGGHFDWVDGRRVPGSLMRLPEGHYHNWHRGGEEGRGHEGHREAGRERGRGERRD